MNDFFDAFSTSASQPEKVWELNAGFGYDINSAMLVEKAEQVFSAKIQPALANASPTETANKIGVSRQYAACIRDGYRPHPRHWQALAGLVRISGEMG